MAVTTPPRANDRIPLSAEPRGQPRFGGLLRRLVRPTTGLVLPLAGKRWNPLFAVVEHRGRRSGRPYATPVGARRTEGGFVVSLAFGAHVDWHRNLAAAGGGAVRWRGIRHPVGAPQPVDFQTALATFNVVQRIGLRLGRIDGFVLLPDAGEPAG
jgi:deazaflavin-dependent oxidoreductase (nitroreductase family)